MNVINGMDCVPHSEILPFHLDEEAGENVQENRPAVIEHDLFGRFFKPVQAKKDDTRNTGRRHILNYSIVRLLPVPSTLGLNFTLCMDQAQNTMMSTCPWLVPQAVYVEVSHGIEVRITTFYLGTNLSKGQPMHSWR